MKIEAAKAQPHRQPQPTKGAPANGGGHPLLSIPSLPSPSFRTPSYPL